MNMVSVTLGPSMLLIALLLPFPVLSLQFSLYNKEQYMCQVG